MLKNKENSIEVDENFRLNSYLFHEGKNYSAYNFFGAHFTGREQGEVVFRVWAPNAESVSVVGDFNNWDKLLNPLKKVSDSGIFEVYVTNLKQSDCYNYAVTRCGKTIIKSDPYAFYSQKPSGISSKIYDLNNYLWSDSEYLTSRKLVYDKPVNIYEVNLASFKRKKNGRYYSYVEYAKLLVDYVCKMGYTHIELMPMSEYPFDGSWGYQVTGYYSITSRFGTPDEFRYFVDCCHQKGIGVIVDWVPGHFAKDEYGLFEFDGTPCYESDRWYRKENRTWGTRIFDFSKKEVQSFLISNAIFYFEQFHVDGLRVDAVASMLYLDYDRSEDEWIPNIYGGNYNLEAIAFLRKLNTEVFTRFPNALMIAEESTAFPLITKPVDVGGLGFNFKWNMGWMNDSLSYMQCDAYFRASCHDKMTFSMMYAFSENFVLPISHDEVVHGKKSLIDKIHGNNIQDKFASLRAFNLYMFAHPGKKLSFMGNEFGQFREWKDNEGLEFFMTKFDNHKKLKIFNKQLNEIYKSTPALYEIEDSWDGFRWISADERDNNILAFERRDKAGNILVAIINFSGNTYFNYRLGVEKGEYNLLINSDDKKYGGKGLLKGKTFKSVRKTAHYKKNSIRFNLSPFTAIYFVKK